MEYAIALYVLIAAGTLAALANWAKVKGFSDKELATVLLVLFLAMIWPVVLFAVLGALALEDNVQEHD